MLTHNHSVERRPQYDSWIDMYGGEDFGATVRSYIGLVDRACVTASDETLKKMHEHFNMSCKLEHMFWDQANNIMEWPKELSDEQSQALS